MAIVIKPLKNLKKIAKEIKKICKDILYEKPNALIGVEPIEMLNHVFYNFKYISKFDWFDAYMFPTTFNYKKGPFNFDKIIIDQMISKINLPLSHYFNMFDLATKHALNNTLNDLFLFKDFDGVDLLFFFIDFRGNFIFNDYESKRTYLNLDMNKKVVTMGLKSILKAKKIVCFYLDENQSNVLNKLNSKTIDYEDPLTFLHLHHDITLLTLTDLFDKSEVNYGENNFDEKRAWNVLNEVDDYVPIDFEEESEPQNEQNNLDSNNVDLETQNQNMSNLDNEIQQNLQEEEPIEELEQEDEMIQEELIEEQVLEEKEPLKEEEVIEEQAVEDEEPVGRFIPKDNSDIQQDFVPKTKKSTKKPKASETKIEEKPKQKTDDHKQKSEPKHEDEFEPTATPIHEFLYQEPDKFDSSESTKYADFINLKEFEWQQKIKESQDKIDQLLTEIKAKQEIIDQMKIQEAKNQIEEPLIVFEKPIQETKNESESKENKELNEAKQEEIISTITNKKIVKDIEIPNDRILLYQYLKYQF